VVAEKVESADDLNRCIDHGFDLFQGYHLAKPEMLRRPARHASRDSADALRTALAENVDAERIEAIVSSDPSLTFRLLTAVNANAFGLDRRVESVAEALGLLGMTKLRCLADLMASSHDVLEESEAIALGAARGRMAATLLADTDTASAGVLAALLSVSDRMYAAPLGDVLEELPLQQELTSAILFGHGSVGRTLDIIRACERDDRAQLDELAPGRADELLELHGGSAARGWSADAPDHGSAERSETPEHA
jgi:EAL and modified HD-GYP domain-containing signal transduction protein